MPSGLLSFAMNLQDRIRQHRHLRVRSAAARPHRARHAGVRRGLRRRPQSRLPASQGYDVCGNDADRERDRAGASAGRRRWRRAARIDFRVEPIEHTSFPDAHADVVMASAVLHFARDPRHFEAMLRQMWRVLRPGGLFFARLASTIGIAGRGRAARQRALPSAGRLRSLPGRRRGDRGVDRAAGRQPARSDQNHGRRRPAVDDDLGRAAIGIECQSDG